MLKLRIEKNKIINTNGEEVILKGININYPGILKFQENHDFLEDIRQIKKLGAMEGCFIMETTRKKRRIISLE